MTRPTNTPEPIGRLPTINVPAIFKRQGEILEEPDVINAIGTMISGDRFETLAAAFHAHFPKQVPLENVRESMMPLLGKEATPDSLQLTAWRLSANAKRLQRGPVYPWRGQATKEWVPMQVLGVDKKFNFKGAPGAVVECVILAGSPASKVLYKFWSKRFAGALSRRFGFTAPWGDLPFHDMLQLFNLRFFARIDPKLCKDQPDFDVLSASGSQVKANREILQMRARKDATKFKCPKGYTVPCQNCVYGLDFCPAATHPLTYVWQNCTECKKDGWTDPYHHRRKICVPCWQVKMARQASRRD